jgi:hypothetical protein
MRRHTNAGLGRILPSETVNLPGFFLLNLNASHLGRAGSALLITTSVTSTTTSGHHNAYSLVPFGRYMHFFVSSETFQLGFDREGRVISGRRLVRRWRTSETKSLSKSAATFSSFSNRSNL